MGQIKAIDTVYNGYRFRSRLEARWAVFFDTLGIEYEYEPEGFDLGEAGWYLPDFYLRKQNLWLEIKPLCDDPKQLEDKRYDAFNKALDRMADYEIDPPVYSPDFYILAGDPYFDAYRVIGRNYVLIDGKYEVQGLQNFSESGSMWTECPLCHRFDIAPLKGYMMNGEGMFCEWCDVKDRLAFKDTETAYFHKGHVVSEVRGAIARSPQLTRAYNAARQARFEHGENPR